MLNINQNFDLKAPVFNFDRDYFNSVEELNAYDASNVPNHFVTNVAGMLYQFTDGKWMPMIGTTLEIDDPAEPDDVSYQVNLIGRNCYINKQPESSIYTFCIGKTDGEGNQESYITIDSDSTIDMSSNEDDMHPNIIMCQAIGGVNKYMQIGGTDDGFGLTTQNSETSNIKMFIDKEFTQVEQDGGYSPVDMSLTDDGYSANINAGHGFTHKTDDGFTSHLDGEALNMRSQVGKSSINSWGLSVYDENNKQVISLQSFEENSLTLGSDKKFKISRQLDNTEGGIISGIKSLTAFANPSATKVWATDGSTVDLSTKANVSDLDAKANKSDVLLKKSTSGGYYIEENSNKLGSKAFAANNTCTASGIESHAEGHSTRTTGGYSHAEGWQTLASGTCSHTEGEYNEANGYCSHAQGSYNVSTKDIIHSVGIGTITARKNAEYIYAKNNTNSSALADDPKNGYKYLIGVGGYDGISTDNTTYKSVQEVIADLTARIEQLETKVKALEDANTPA